MHDEHSLELNNMMQFSSLRQLLFLLWELRIMDDYMGNYLLDEVDYMWGTHSRKADKCL